MKARETKLRTAPKRTAPKRTAPKLATTPVPIPEPRDEIEIEVEGDVPITDPTEAFEALLSVLADYAASGVVQTRSRELLYGLRPDLVSSDDGANVGETNTEG